MRDVGEGRWSPPDDRYPYPLRGLTAAIEQAHIRSFAGAPPQEIVSIGGNGAERVIRRYEGGREVPLPE